MPRPHTILLYKFEELSPEAKEKARDWYREFIFTDSCDWEHVYEDAQAIAKLMGIDIGTRTYKTVGGHTGQEPTIYFSGFSSQGDGASFEGLYHYKADAYEAVKEYAPKDEALGRLVAALQEAQAPSGGKIAFAITTSGHYSHSASMSFELLDSDSEGEAIDIESIKVEDEKKASLALRNFADWIYRQLESEYDYQSSDAAIDESLEANEYEFTVDGKRA